MGNNDIFGLFFANQHFKCAEKALTGNPKMERCSVIHIEIPDQASSSYRTKSRSEVHRVGRLRHAALLIANSDDPCVTLLRRLFHATGLLPKIFSHPIPGRSRSRVLGKTLFV